MEILVGYDGSNASREALNQARKQAEAFGGRIHILNSQRQDSYEVEEKKHLIGRTEEELETLKQGMIDAGIPCESHLLITGETPAEDLIEFARHKQIDMIVIGVRRRSRVGKLMFGSTAHPVILHAPCPVLAVK